MPNDKPKTAQDKKEARRKVRQFWAAKMIAQDIPDFLAEEHLMEEVFEGESRKLAKEIMS